jgi:hypothetical protein
MSHCRSIPLAAKVLQFCWVIELNKATGDIVPKTKTAEVTLDRRAKKERRQMGERRRADHPVAVERRDLVRREKVNRRRQIDPTTCERDYTDDEVEFMHALDRYKRASGRMFPTCSEVLEVIRSLGYAKVNAAVPTETELQAQ